MRLGINRGLLILMTVMVMFSISASAQYFGPPAQPLPVATVSQGASDGSTACNSGPCLTVTKSTSAANAASTLNNGGTISEKGARWPVISAPAVSLKASASQATGGAGVRHVADCVSFSAAASTAIAAATVVTVNLRDGATGAGTVIWSHTIFVPASTGQIAPAFSVCGLNLVGTANTAMTLEFSALVTNLFENVSLSGYDLN